MNQTINNGPVWYARAPSPIGELVLTSKGSGLAGIYVTGHQAIEGVLAKGTRDDSFFEIPCHRVIGSAGSLTGYAGGLDKKRWLLAHENAVRNRKTAQSDRGGASRRWETTRA